VIPLRLLVDDLLRGFSGSLGARGQDLVVFSSGRLPRSVYSDFTRLEEILRIILSNAIDASSAGALIEFSINMETSSRGRKGLRIEISDQGCGMTRHEGKRLFSVAEGATGLAGLRGGEIAGELVRQLDGELTVASMPDEGTTVSLWTPAEVAETSGIWSSFNGTLIAFDANEERSLGLMQQMGMLGGHGELYHDPEEFTCALEGLGRNASSETVILLQIDDPEARAELILSTFRRFKGSDVRLILSVPGDQAGKGDFAIATGRILPRPFSPWDLADEVGLYEMEPPALLEESDSGSVCDAQGEGPNILLVEDDAANKRVADGLLLKLGLRADWAENGEVALEKMAGKSYDLILMDCQMPIMDGYATTREIRRREHLKGDGWHVPIIAVTANAMAGDRERCLKAGMDDYLTKPVRKALLEEKINEALARSSPGLVKEEPSWDDLLEAEEPEEPSIGDVFGDQGLPDVIRELAEGTGTEAARDIIVDFLDSNDTLITEISEGISEQNREKVLRASHTLKGTAELVGLFSTSEKAALIEAAARDDLWNDLEDLESRLQIASRVESPALRSVIERCPARTSESMF